MTYVDGFVVPVPTARKADYIAHSKKAMPYFKKAGALTYVECWGDDVPDGETTSFPMAVKLKPDETAVFAWVTWPSKEVRDAAMQSMMDNPDFEKDFSDMPFDGQRLIFGGFEMMIDE